MQCPGYTAKVTMSGLEEINRMAVEIHEKSRELAAMINEFQVLSLSLGIEIVPAAVNLAPEALAKAMRDKGQGVQ